jgi:hypothetical protein
MKPLSFLYKNLLQNLAQTFQNHPLVINRRLHRQNRRY